MRKVLSVFIAVCLVLSLFTGIFVSLPSARALSEGDFGYCLDGIAPNQTARIQKYTGSGGTVDIPSSLGGHRVTVIGDNAFLDCRALTNVTIGSGVATIADGAFGDCTSLTSVTIPNSVTTIGVGAFDGCLKLTSVTIPSSVTSIGDSAFGGTGLTKILVNGNNLNYASVDGVLYNKNITVLIQYPIRNTRTSFTIPNSVTNIGFYAFNGCWRLTSVTIPNSVTTIADGAFSVCMALTNVTIGSGVATIGNLAFYGCTKLTAAYFLGNAPTGTSNMFQLCAPGFTVHYVTGAPGWSNPWYGYPTAIEKKSTKEQTVLVLHVGSSPFAMNGVSKTLDSPPVIKNGRTLVPIRAIIEALGGTVAWDPIAHKVTVTLGTKTVVLWIGKSAATVNGVSTPIDSTNAKVVPEIINSRTMLPLRFVTENLSATVGWDAAAQTITITYTP
jgi:hypothetical protein